MVRLADKHSGRRRQWITQLEARCGKNILAAAIANTYVRVAWHCSVKKRIKSNCVDKLSEQKNATTSLKSDV